MDRFIANENVKRFRKKLADCSDEEQKGTLKQLLAAEEAKLKQFNRGS